MTTSSVSPVRPWESLGPTWVEIDLDVLSANLAAVRAFVAGPRWEESARYAAAVGLRPPVGPPKVLVVVKSDAYGHGAVATAGAALEAGADMLGVSTLLEGLELRQAGVAARILVFNPLTPPEAAVAVRAGLTPTVNSLETAARLAEEVVARRPGEEFAVHVSLDTGMSRYGLRPDDAAEFAARLAALPGLSLEGVYTHFPTGADRGPASVARMRRHLDTFARAVRAVEARGLRVPLRHAACSSAVLELPESYLDLVRVGNLFYGYGSPTKEPRVREAWKMVTRVLEVREVPPGTGVGYGPDVVVRRPRRLATVPVGYADGVGVEIHLSGTRPRERLTRLAKAALALLGRLGLLLGPLARLRRYAWSQGILFHEGRPVPILGRVSMQQTILDITGRPAIGPGSLLTVEVHRVLANPRLGRVYYSGGEPILARTAPGLAEAAAGWEPPAAGTGPGRLQVPGSEAF